MGRPPDRSRFSGGEKDLARRTAGPGGRLGLCRLTLSFILLPIAASALLAQTTPEPPAAPEPRTPASSQPPSDQKKEDTGNPAEAVAEETGKVTLKAAEATVKVGELALVKARNWEAGWLTGIFVEKGEPRIPLTFNQRRELYLQQTLTTPGAYMKRMFGAGIDQARGVPSQWDDGWGGYAERWASREGQFISANTLAAAGNAALKYEPRYDQCDCSGFWRRTRHAIVRNFLTYGRDEQEYRPQWALYGGAFGGGLISTAWKPQPRNAFAEGGRAMLEQAGYGAALNFFIEFAGDINRKLGAKH